MTGLSANLAARLSASLSVGGAGASDFITQWTVAGDATARTITLPLVNTRAEGALAYDCYVDWGDGTAVSHVTAYNDAARIHTYATNGTYQVRIWGTMEGWSFNNGGDKLKITRMISWGRSSRFNGFKYLKGGFYGCTNLSGSLPSGGIPASGTGLLADGFAYLLYGCAGLTGAIPAGMFRAHALVTSSAFYTTFYGCSGLTGTIPADLFRYNTLVSTDGFNSTFYSCSGLTGTIPADLFRYNTLVSTNGFNSCFRVCSGLTGTIPADLFRYNVLALGFGATFYQSSGLQLAADGLFRFNTLVNTWSYCFSGCTKLQLSAYTFYAEGEQSTRFLNKTVTFGNCFDRASFTGVQGIAPDLWNCDFGETITLDVAPAVDWDPADLITGQSSGATCVVVSKVSTLIYKVYKIKGTFSLGEIVGVTGVADKLADQGAANPIITSGVTKTDCFNGAGNSLTSLSNYNDIPAIWV